MDFERLKAFRAVATEKSFSRAARKLFRTQPAVSQAIRSLEDELGERLFLRLGRTVEMTQAGEVLLEHAQQAFEALEQGRMRLDALRGLKEGKLTIGTSDTTACYILPDALRVFRSRYPGIEIVLSNRPSPATLEHVLAREGDIGIVTLPIHDARVAVEELLVREDVVICSPRHPLSGRKRVRIEELAGHPLLLLDKGSSTRSFIDERLSRAGVVPHVAMELASIEVIKKLVQLDFGISIVPRVAVGLEAERDELRAIRLFSAGEARKLGVIYPRKGYLALAAQEFLKVLRQGRTGGDSP